MNQPATHLDCLAAKASQFYTLPAVAVQVLELTGDPSVDTQALRKCIENDPALTTRILQVVNSSLFGLSGHVSDLNQALALLGIKPLKLLVLGFSLPTRFFQNIAGEVLAQYWRHTLTKAVAAREIAETLWRQPGDEAFIAGLLQDLGLLLLIQELGEPYVELFRKVHAEGADLLDCERRALGFDHTTLTASILRRWHLPEVLSAAVEIGAGFRDSGGPLSHATDLRKILHLAGLLARLLADGASDLLDELLATGREFCSLTPARLDALVGTLSEKIQPLAEVLSVEMPEGDDYLDILARANRRLADVASEAATDMLASRPRGEPSWPRPGTSILERITSLCNAVEDAAHQASAPAVPAAASSRAVLQSATMAPPQLKSTPRRPSDKSQGGGGPAVLDQALTGQLAAAVHLCRQSRSPLSFLMVDPSDASGLFLTLGPEEYSRFRRFLETACRSLDPPPICLPHGEAGFAIVLPNCERQAAVRTGNQLIDKVRGLSLRSTAGSCCAASLAIGAATVSLPPKNFPPEDLFRAADRCLYGSRLSGGGVVKSIEIY